MLGSAESEHHRLISHEIIFEVFQPTVCDHDTSTSQTNVLTDGRLAVEIERSIAQHRTVKTILQLQALQKN